MLDLTNRFQYRPYKHELLLRSGHQAMDHQIRPALQPILIWVVANLQAKNPIAISKAVILQE